jgi:hypothetical protein
MHGKMSHLGQTRYKLSNKLCMVIVILRERPFNLKGGLWFFSKKKYSDFGGGKKK